MMNPRNTEPFALVIFGLAILVGSPALVRLAPTELVATLTATPLRQAVSVVLFGALVAGVVFWAIPRVRVRGPPAAEGGED